MRPAKWEPRVGHQLKAVKFISEELRLRKLGSFTEEEWEEPEVEDVKVQVWTEIRETGFGGNNLKNRDLRRIWERRHTIAEDVKALELGRSGGIYKGSRRNSGASRAACLGKGQRSMVEEEEGGEEQGEENGGTKKVRRRAKPSAWKPIYEEVRKTFENWRMGGHYVDSEDFYKHSVT